MWCVLLLAMMLAGCSSKSSVFTGTEEELFQAEHFIPKDNERFWLPDDDGKPLSEAERQAFLSTGDFDSELTMEQMADVLRHFKRLVHRERGTVEASVERARHYLPMIRSVLKENDLPQELAYLPFVESNYSVLVLSRSQALGMWQFIPSTASYYGMKRNAWLDERRDPLISTQTAATYFLRLYEFFDGDWHLAISAYNAGEGKIRRGLDATGAESFFELRARDDQIKDPRLKMTKENSQYLPKFLAVCKIMRNLELLGFSPVGLAPDMVPVSVRPGIELRALARQAGMSWDTFMLYNAIYLRGYSPPDRTTRAMIPAGSQKRVQAWLKDTKGTRTYASWRPYTVRSRDTVRTVARKTGASANELVKVNQLDVTKLRAGTVMLVPPPKKTASRSVKIQKNSSRKVASASHDAKAQLLAKKISSGKNVANSKRVQGKMKKYTVCAGDSMWSIARRFNVPPKELLAANGMTVESASVHPGDVIYIK